MSTHTRPAVPTVAPANERLTCAQAPYVAAAAHDTLLGTGYAMPNPLHPWPLVALTPGSEVPRDRRAVLEGLVRRLHGMAAAERLGLVYEPPRTGSSAGWIVLRWGESSHASSGSRDAPPPFVFRLDDGNTEHALQILDRLDALSLLDDLGREVVGPMLALLSDALAAITAATAPVVHRLPRRLWPLTLGQLRVHLYAGAIEALGHAVLLDEEPGRWAAVVTGAVELTADALRVLPTGAWQGRWSPARIVRILVRPLLTREAGAITDEREQRRLVWQLRDAAYALRDAPEEREAALAVFQGHPLLPETLGVAMLGGPPRQGGQLIDLQARATWNEPLRLPRTLQPDAAWAVAPTRSIGRYLEAIAGGRLPTEVLDEEEPRDDAD